MRVRKLNGSEETQLQFQIMTGSFVLFDLRTAEISRSAGANLGKIWEIVPPVVLMMHLIKHLNEKQFFS